MVVKVVVVKEVDKEGDKEADKEADKVDKQTENQLLQQQKLYTVAIPRIQALLFFIAPFKGEAP